MDICIVLLILIIVVAGLILYHFLNNNTTKIILGGVAIGTSLLEPDIVKNILFIPNNAKIVVDGHNMIHDLLYNEHITVEKFDQGIRNISEIITRAFPTHNIHIVLKNPPFIINNDLKNPPFIINNDLKKCDDEATPHDEIKKCNNHKIPYVQKMMSISKQYPHITYHLAYGTESKKANKSHHLKARDDYLTTYIGSDSYIISKDMFRDFKQFKEMKAFKHYTIKNGDVVDPVESIKPSVHYTHLTQPSVGNHFIFQLITKNELESKGLKNGSIILEDKNKFAKIYLAI
jgi:hypothetical protein